MRVKPTPRPHPQKLVVSIFVTLAPCIWCTGPWISWRRISKQSAKTPKIGSHWQKYRLESFESILVWEVRSSVAFLWRS